MQTYKHIYNLLAQTSFDVGAFISQGWNFLLRTFPTLGVLCCHLLVFAQDDGVALQSGIYVHATSKVGIFGTATNSKDTLFNYGSIVLIGDSLMNCVPITGKGSLELNGTLEQQIMDGSSISVDTLTLNNPEGIGFDNSIYVDKYVDFKNGILWDTENLIEPKEGSAFVCFNATATYMREKARDESHIEGFVQKKGKGDFVFPTGDKGFYRPAAILNKITDTTVSVRYYLDYITYPEENLPENLSIFRNEYWYASGAACKEKLGFTYDSRTSHFDLQDENLSMLAFNNHFQDGYQLMNTYTFNSVNHTAIASRECPQEGFLWCGFASQKELPSNNKIPQIITPNGDGYNDVFVIPNLIDYPENSIRIINRLGNLVYHMDNYDNSWDGSPNQKTFGNRKDNKLPTGTYYVFIYSQGSLVYKDFIQLLNDD